ncbi:MAG: hypothetical protein HFE76_00930 [Firmicutes bacterium]|nr:hypothetical protein [Bacillota bacterium]
MKLSGDYLLQSDYGSLIIKENETPYRTQRNFKDRVFRMLFAEPAHAWELFCALEDGPEVSKAEQPLFEVVTLQNVFGSHKLNDLAFQYSRALVSIVEHQASWSENMPLRELIYLAKTYEKILDMKKLYRKKRCKIPLPHLYVLYNGEEERPLETIQRLSDAYALSQGIHWGDFQVLVININWEKQHPILSKCRVLGEYAQFVHQVRYNLRQEGVNRDEALRSALGTCIEQGILKEFLETHRSEVENMLFDITEEEFLEIRAEEMAEDLVVERNKELDRRAEEYDRRAEENDRRAEETKRRAEEIEKYAEVLSKYAKEIDKYAGELDRRMEEKAAKLAEAREQTLIRNIARSGVLPAQISQMTGLSEEQVQNYLA